MTNLKYEKIYNLAKQYEADTAEFLAEMVRTPAFSGKEKEVIKVIEKKMLAVGFDDVKIDGLGNVIGRIGNGPRVVAFDAHIDTVYPGDLAQWETDPFDPVVKNGKMTGRGTVDQEGGMASMVTAARIIKELNLNEEFTIYFTGTVMEEDCDGLCWNYIILEEKIKPELVVITEPTNLNIYRGHRGRMEMEVSIPGVSCHGSAPERGDNAIYKMSRIALEIEKLHERLKDDPFLGKGSITVSQFFFNSPSQCAVPDFAKISLDRRLTFGETKELAVEEVQDCAARAGYPDAKVNILTYKEPAYTGLEYPMEKYYPTWVLDESSSYLDMAKESYRDVLNKEPFVDKWTFSTNGVTISGIHGIPCIGMGPGNEIYAHAANETIEIEHLTNAAAFYASFIAKLNGK